MAAALDLVGQKFGQLTVTAPAGRDNRGMTWHVRCECGREEIYAQYRLTQKKRSTVDACSVCRAPKCSVCGGDIPPLENRVSYRGTCSEDCKATRLKETQRNCYHRRVADPEKREKIGKAALARHHRKMATDPIYVERERQRTQARLEAIRSSPEQAEKRRLIARLGYAKRAKETHRRRREMLNALSPERLTTWMERVRKYDREYRRKWREELIKNPDEHRRYLDLMAEYRRRRALARLMAEANILRDDNGS